MNLEMLALSLHIPKEEIAGWLEEEQHIILLSEALPLSQDTIDLVTAHFQPPEPSGESPETQEQPVSAQTPVSPEVPAKKEDATVSFIRECFEQNYLIIVDTCSIMGDVDNQFSSFFPFMKRIAPVLRERGKMVVIPYIVYSEIAWFRDYTPKTARGKQAASILPKLDHLVRHKLAAVTGGREDWPRNATKPFADEFLCSIASYMRTNGRNVLVITQDRALTEDLHAVLSKKSVRATTTIVVRRLDKKEGILLKPSGKFRKEK